MTMPDLFGAEVKRARAIGSHESASGGTDEWLTPPDVIRALGPFDLDPCAPIKRPWPTAARHYTIEDNGLSKDWSGFVWCNPPYAHVPLWLNKLADHGNGIALIFARTETRTWFTHVWPKASGVLFLRGRLAFHYVDGRKAKANSGAPSALVAYGPEAVRRLSSNPLPGQFVPLAERPTP